WNRINKKSFIGQFKSSFKSIKTNRISWKKCFKQGHLENIESVKQYNTNVSLRCHYNRKFK
ncbi:hypothetical protein BCV72DRAFT_330031, partial [Rhizopus microsporus var. microsporus]